ncbi:uncharacterized protein LOC114907078 [Monodon monoceros]|uniref:uncharacterized protein LOC114907078 n=1 Tax=Monodon monoceros TaxID=40151 RepID=UPI0010F8147B|nr:uncharacterized protein LOC114907078 [Monodon monoceros]
MEQLKCGRQLAGTKTALPGAGGTYPWKPAGRKPSARPATLTVLPGSHTGRKGPQAPTATDPPPPPPRGRGPLGGGPSPTGRFSARKLTPVRAGASRQGPRPSCWTPNSESPRKKQRRPGDAGSQATPAAVGAKAGLSPPPPSSGKKQELQKERKKGKRGEKELRKGLSERLSHTVLATESGPAACSSEEADAPRGTGRPSAGEAAGRAEAAAPSRRPRLRRAPDPAPTPGLPPSTRAERAGPHAGARSGSGPGPASRGPAHSPGSSPSCRPAPRGRPPRPERGPPLSSAVPPAGRPAPPPRGRHENPERGSAARPGRAAALGMLSSRGRFFGRK